MYKSLVSIILYDDQTPVILKLNGGKKWSVASEMEQRDILKQYKEESHVLIASGTGAILQNEALKKQRINRRILLELPGFLGLPASLATTDLIVTLPRHIGETLAHSEKLKVLDCPVTIPSFTVKQHWHARYHNDPANIWLRSICSELFLS